MRPSTRIPKSGRTTSLIAIAISLFASTAFAEKSKNDEEEPAITIPSERGQFHSIAFESEPDSAQRAWEVRPYQVAVWLCLDGSPKLGSSESQLCKSIASQCHLFDASGWNVRVGTPPSQWHWGLFESESDSSFAEKVLIEPELQHYDKLMVVRVRESGGQISIDAREFDIRTQQQGPRIESTTRFPHAIPSITAKLLTRAFMPLARIDEVTPANEAFLKSRGIEACIRTRINEDLVAEVVPIRDSPVFVRKSERFQPVVVRTNKSGDITKLDAIPFTFIVADSVEKNDIVGTLHSNQRAPLAGRKSKRAEKLALVIRPPDGTTTLILNSRTEDPQPLEGYEVWSRRPGMDRNEDSEFIGKTDWKGELTVPPSEDLRLLLIKRGNRPLAKLPVIPGFHPILETSVTNDDTRLQAAGVVKGLQSEVINLVALRALYESRIRKSIERKQLELARKELREYTDMETPQELSARLADEEIRLRNQTTNQREQEFIKTMFDQLRSMVNSDLVKTKEIELRDMINAGGVPESEKKKELPAPAAIVDATGKAIDSSQTGAVKPKTNDDDDEAWDDEADDESEQQANNRPGGNRNQPGASRPNRPGPQVQTPGSPGGTRGGGGGNRPRPQLQTPASPGGTSGGGGGNRPGGSRPGGASPGPATPNSPGNGPSGSGG